MHCEPVVEHGELVAHLADVVSAGTDGERAGAAAGAVVHEVRAVLVGHGSAALGDWNGSVVNIRLQAPPGPPDIQQLTDAADSEPVGTGPGVGAPPGLALAGSVACAITVGGAHAGVVGEPARRNHQPLVQAA